MATDEMIPKGKGTDLDAQLDEVAELPPPKKAKTELNVYKRRTSTIWRHLQMLPTKDEEQPTCKCKKCEKEYIAAGTYVGFNLKRQLGLCPRKFQVPLSTPGSTIATPGNVFFIYMLALSVI